MKKSNVFLTSDQLYTYTSQRGCGNLTPDEMNDLYQSIKNSNIPSKSCASSIYAELKQTSCSAPKFERSSSHLTITINPKKQCGIRKDTRCADCIISGKCTDEFVINLIGKKLFANKYQGK